MNEHINPTLRGFLWFAPPERIDADPSSITAGKALRESSNEGDLNEADLEQIDREIAEAKKSPTFLRTAIENEAWQREMQRLVSEGFLK